MSEEKPTEQGMEEPTREGESTRDVRREMRESARRDQFEWQRERQERRAEHRSQRWERRSRRRPSLFWPVILIGAGALWLLGNLEIISGENLSVLLRLWPLIFIVIGLDVLIGRESPLISGLIALVAVGAVVALVIVGPSMGLAREGASDFFGVPLDVSGDVEVKSDTFDAPLGDAESARVALDLSVWQTSVQALEDSDRLIDADLDYVGDIRFRVEEGRETEVSLGEENFRFSFGPALDFGNYAWDIGLSPEVPLDLSIDVGAGPAELDLSGLELSHLTVAGGAGPVGRLDMPGGAYDVGLDMGAGPVTAALGDGARSQIEVDGGAGPFTLSLGDDTEVDMGMEMGAGPFTLNVGDDAALALNLAGAAGPATIDVPQDAALRVEVRSAASGPVSLPGRLQLVDDLDDGERKTGIWETDGFDRAATQIIITVRELGSGPLTVR